MAVPKACGLTVRVWSLPLLEASQRFATLTTPPSRRYATPFGPNRHNIYPTPRSAHARAAHLPLPGVVLAAPAQKPHRPASPTRMRGGAEPPCGGRRRAVTGRAARGGGACFLRRVSAVGAGPGRESWSWGRGRGGDGGMMMAYFVESFWVGERREPFPRRSGWESAGGRRGARRRGRLGCGAAPGTAVGPGERAGRGGGEYRRGARQGGRRRAVPCRAELLLVPRSGAARRGRGAVRETPGGGHGSGVRPRRRFRTIPRRRRGLRLHPLAAFVPACPEGRRAAGGPVRDTVCHCAPSMYLGVVGTLPWRKPGENVKRWIRIVAEPSSGARSIRIRCGMGLKHRSRRSHKPSACLRGCCSAAHPIVPRVCINDWGKRNSKYWSRQKNKNKNKSCRSIWFCINNGYP